MGITVEALAAGIADNGVKKVGETVGNRAVNFLIDFAKKKYGEGKVYLGSAFDRYLDNACKRYNQVRTLATGTYPRCIIGKNSIYEEINLTCDKEEISTHSASYVITVSKNILILGTGGIGKSMLMRYLFLEAAANGDYVPVLLELRRIGIQKEKPISLLQLIYDCLSDFDVELDKDQFEYSLRSGKYLFLLDGFDEVREDISKEAAEAIQKFCSKYPDNPCITTSRPRKNTSPMETFTIMESMPLKKEQAISLASKIWKEDVKTREFCEQLDKNLFETHKDFAENPLLLSMMFLTFMRNSSIPDHLSDFYKKAYEALYSAHDTNDKGYFQRDFQCKNLDEGDFHLLFSHFCFKTYFIETYEFTEEKILEFIQKSIDKLVELKHPQFRNVNPRKYLADLRNVVCMIIKDGTEYRFAHRTFQAYFAAVYTADSLTDEQQKRLFHDQLSSSFYFNNNDYYRLLYQIEGNRFGINALEEPLRALTQEADASDNPTHYFMCRMIDLISLNDNDYACLHREGNWVYNAVNLFEKFIIEYELPIERKSPAEAEVKTVVQYLKMISPTEDINMVEVETTNMISAADKDHLFRLLENRYPVSEYRKHIDRWLAELDEQRQTLSKPNFFDEL